MKKIKTLGAGLLALSTLLLSSYADGRGNGSSPGADSSNAPYGKGGSSSSSYDSSMNPPYTGGNSNGSSYSTRSTNTYSNSYSGRPNSQSQGMYGQGSSSYSDQSYRRGPSQAWSGNSDMHMFESKDENEAYSSYGFTRGDIYYIYRYKFDPTNIVTVDGTVEKVIRVQYPDGDNYLVAILSTQDGDLLINLGPVNYFDAQRIVLDEGDSVQVTGSKIRLNGRFAVIAMDLNLDGKVISLRDQAGQPIWKQGMAPGMGGQGPMGGPGSMGETNMQTAPRSGSSSSYSGPNSTPTRPSEY